MDASILTVATPVLQDELNASPTMLQAIFAAYTFTFGVLVVTGARLGDDRGHGNMFLAGLAGFTASSLLCGLAPSAPVLLAGRLVQGACGALMTPQTLQVIQRRFDGDARAKAVGLYSLILSVGVLVGQLVGGVIVTTAGWRWALLIHVPAGSALFVAAYRALRTEPPGRGQRLDVAGVVLLSGAMALLLVPLLLGREQGWPAWIWPSLVAGAAGLALFARVERGRAAPLLDLTVLPQVARGLITVAGVMGSYGALLFSLTLHLQDDLGYSARSPSSTPRRLVAAADVRQRLLVRARRAVARRTRAGRSARARAASRRRRSRARSPTSLAPHDDERVAAGEHARASGVPKNAEACALTRIGSSSRRPSRASISTHGVPGRSTRSAGTLRRNTAAAASPTSS